VSEEILQQVLKRLQEVEKSNEELRREIAENQKEQVRNDSFLNSITDLHVLFDRDWRYLYVNEAGVRAIGRPREQIVGYNVWELYPDLINSEIDRQLHRAMDERIPITFVFYYPAPNTWWENRFFPVPEGLAVFATDITPRRQAEEKLQESQQRFIAFMDNLPGFAWMKDTEGRYVYANKMLEQLEPLQKGWLGKTDEEIWPPEIAEQYRFNDQKVIASLEALQTVEPYTAEGKQRSVLVSKFPILDRANHVILVGGISVDITERRQAEEALADYTRRLQGLPGRVLRAQETERRRIARELHDEIGQSLTAIKIQLLAMQHRPANEQDIKECIRITDEVLSQVHNLSLDLRPSQLDELGLTAALRWHLDRQMQAANLTPHFSVDSLPDRLQSDVEIACFRVAQEALTNVIRHAGARRVWVDLHRSEDRLILIIRDDGQGFDVSAARERALQGASMGLIGMQERVELVGGQLRLNSAPGQGTEIHAVFPLSYSAPSK
jgi:two-component system sensor histidine kinase UhpB